MDLQTLSNLFASTFNHDPNVQKSAELQVRKVRRTVHFLQATNVVILSAIFLHGQLGGQEGMISSVLQIIGNDSIDPYVLDAFFAPFKPHTMVVQRYASRCGRLP